MSKRKKTFDLDYEKRELPLALIEAREDAEKWGKKELRARSAYLLLNGAPEFAVNHGENGKYRLLAGDRDFYAAKGAGISSVTVRVYRLTEKNAEAFSCVERLKTEELGAMDEGYLMKRLIEEFSFTQDDIAVLIGKSRPAVANTLRLLTLAPEVVGLVESGQLSAGHARALVKVPKEEQFAFASGALKRGYSVREMERAVKAYLTPPEILQQEKEAKAAAKGEQLKAFIERMRAVFRTKVSLVGNDKKGRIYVDYYSAEDLYRFEELLERLEQE